VGRSEKHWNTGDPSVGSDGLCMALAGDLTEGDRGCDSAVSETLFKDRPEIPGSSDVIFQEEPMGFDGSQSLSRYDRIGSYKVKT
jgi:hypothetical protein